MCNLNLKGIWIPIEILTDKKLSDKEKTIYAIIIYLSKESNYCYCTKQNHKKSKANFEERDYTGYDFTRLYANADIIA